MDIRLDNQVAVVTGAASGIGLACAELLAASGAKTALVDMNADNLAKATEQVQAKGIARGYQLDVADTQAITPTFSHIRQELGEIDILICCAGTTIRQAAHEVTEVAWDTVMAVNAKGLFLCNQAAAVQSMIPRKSGAIVNMASLFGITGGRKGTTAYSASKGAVVQLTRQEAIEWAPYNIRVNAIAPSYVQTPMTKGLLSNPELKTWVLNKTPLHRLATGNDIATATLFLASDAAKMITGVILPIDGGWTIN